MEDPLYFFTANNKCVVKCCDDDLCNGVCGTGSVSTGTGTGGTGHTSNEVIIEDTGHLISRQTDVTYSQRDGTVLASTRENLSSVCVNNKSANQPAHPRRMISAFGIR